MSDKAKLEKNEEEILANAAGFWQKNSKLIIGIAAVVVVSIGGYLGYKNFIQLPNEQKASEEMFFAESNFRKDSFNIALNGTQGKAGFLKVISKYGNTDAGNLAHLYAGECYMQLGDFQKAVKHLEDFNPGAAKQVEAKVTGLLGDAYAELKKNNEAIDLYAKAGSLFPDDQSISSEYLFRGALLAEINGNTEKAIELYQQIKDKYPRTDKGFVVDKYLARLGVVK
ncbi:MAG: tetratricopeptide repeat protein [Bacteroidota bacterium]|jgi:tetratricopeptide (TPR) repeat protein